MLRLPRRGTVEVRGDATRKGIELASWSEFETAEPAMAADGRRLLEARGDGQALLATVRGADGAPRIHPINVAIVDGELVAFLLESPKRRDLAEDGRYALHAYQDPSQPDEFLVRGRATRVEDEEIRANSAAGWSFEPDETYHLFRFSIEHAVLGLRAADEWPPRYRVWRGDAVASGPGPG
jgi:hypothetical protein